MQLLAFDRDARQRVIHAASRNEQLVADSASVDNVVEREHRVR